MVHAENGDLVDLLVRRALREGNTAAIHHALTRPEIVEAEATGRAARLAEHTGAELFVVHVTCAAAAAEIEAAQQRGVAVSAETCTQYLVNTIDDLRRPGVEGCRYICSPPLRDVSNREPMWEYVRRGILESISTYHCPFRDEQKARGIDDFSLVPNGLPVIQHRLAKLWDEGVVAGRLTPSQLVDRTSTTIARRFGLDAKGAISPGKDADIVVFDPAAPRPYGVATSFMNVDYDLYEGEVASGSVRHTYCRGTLVYDRGEIRTAPGHGRYIPRAAGTRTAVAA
jgi:dihydropyrimidinase